MADNPEGKEFYLKTAVDVAVDLCSWLAEWVLVDLVKAEDITAASNDLLVFAKDFGAAEAAGMAAAPGVLSRHRCRCIRGRKPSIEACDTHPLSKSCEKQWLPAAAFLFGRAGQKIQAFS